jgi:hypothetical protein
MDLIHWVLQYRHLPHWAFRSFALSNPQLGLYPHVVDRQVHRLHRATHDEERKHVFFLQTNGD